MAGCRYFHISRRGSVILLLITMATTLTILELYRYRRQLYLNPEQQYMPFVWKADRKDLDNPLIHKHRYRFILNNETICKSDARVFLLIYVLSSRRNKLSRQIIRQTWASAREYDGKHVRVVFLTGQKNDGSDTSLKRESKQYGDIIEGNFQDTYENLTYKSVMGLHWATNYCNTTSFILRTDDDVVVNIYKLVHFLREIDIGPKQTSGFLYCNVQGQGYGVLPIRTDKSKFFINKTDYMFDLYPPYCHGPGYVFSVDVATQLLESTRKVPFLKFEDVFMGFCTKIAGIEPLNNFFGFYVDISYDYWKPFHWTVLKHLGRAFETDSKQYEYSPVKKSITYYRILLFLIILGGLLVCILCLSFVVCFIPWICQRLFRYSRYAIPAIIVRVRNLNIRLVRHSGVDISPTNLRIARREFV